MSSVYLNSNSSSSTSSASSSNLIRIPGMASGLDTDSIVKSMVSSYQTKIDKANQDEQLVQWKQSGYRDIIKGIKGLQDYFDPLSSKYILGENSMNINAATSDTPSVASATADATAKAGTYTINATQLATQAQIQGGSKDSLLPVADLSKWKGATLNFGTSGTATISAGITSMSDLVANINSQLTNGSVSASYVNDGTTDYIKFTKNSTSTIGVTATASDGTTPLGSITNINSGISSSSLLTTDLGFSAKSGSNDGLVNFTLTNGSKSYNVSLTVSSTSTVQNLVDAVNSATNGAITMNVDDNTGNFSFKSKSYGSSTNIGITDSSSNTTSNNVITNLGFTAKIQGASNSGKTTNSLLTDLGFTTPGNINFTLTNGSNSYNISSTASNPLTATSTVQDLINAVNSETNGTVTMSIDATGKISFSGSSTNMSINDTSGSNNIITQLGISKTTSNATVASGTDAVVSITEPGQSTATTTTQNSNNFTINGVNYSIVNINKTANISVASNADNVVTNIKSFITDYNTIIGTINTKLTEKKDPAYPPLTDAQKSSMSDSQITAWEAKGKVGVLRNDDYLSQLMTELRGVFSSSVYSSYSSSNASSGKVSLSFGQYGSNAIGIDTSSDVTDGGKLILKDETKLKNAITNNLDDFKKLFTGASSIGTLPSNQTYVGSEKYMEDGILKRMDNILRGYVASPGVGEDGTYTLSGTMNIFVNKQYDYSSTGSGGKNTLPDQVYNKTLSISKLKTQMSDAQTRYYNKFTALETALSTLSSQQSQLSSMLGTG